MAKQRLHYSASRARTRRQRINMLVVNTKLPEKKHSGSENTGAPISIQLCLTRVARLPGLRRYFPQLTVPGVRIAVQSNYQET